MGLLFASELLLFTLVGLSEVVRSLVVPLDVPSLVVLLDVVVVWLPAVRCSGVSPLLWVSSASSGSSIPRFHRPNCFSAFAVRSVFTPSDISAGIFSPRATLFCLGVDRGLGSGGYTLALFLFFGSLV